MKLTKLLIARHGNTFGPKDIITRVGKTDLPLVESGINQGEKLGLYLKNNNLIPDIIITSTLKRAIQTAEEAQKAMQLNLTIKHLSIFDEIDYGPDENQPEAQVITRIGQLALEAWEKDAKVPAGWNVDPAKIIRSWQSFVAEFKERHEGKTGLIVTSNGTARFSPHITGNFEEFSSKNKIKMATGAVSLFTISKSDAHWNCVFWNER